MRATRDTCARSGSGMWSRVWRLGAMGVRMATRRINGRARQERNRRILAQSDVCHICGHAGSEAVDHVAAFARTGDESPANLKPAHHAACPTCGRKCNLEKSDKPYAPIIRRSGSLNRPQAPAPPPT